MKEKRFRRGARKLLGLVLAAGLMLGGSATAWADAVSTYSISMGQGEMSVLKGGKVTNSFKVANNDVTATTDWEGDLMVCFNNAQGDYVGVALGSQEIINFYGTIGTLLLDESLDRPVVIGPSARVTKLKVKAPVKVSIWGRVDNGIVEAAASLVTAKGSQTSNISFEDSSARIYINEGSVVDGTTIRSSEDLGGNRYGNSSTSSSKTVSGITLKTNTIYADYDDTLGELLDDLDSNVTAYNRSGRRLYGEVEWEDRSSLKVGDSGRFRFRFIPEDDDYDTVTGSIRIVVDDDDDYEDLDLTIGEINVTKTNNPRRLASYLNKLNNAIEAYNEDGRRVYGEAKWTSNKKVEESGKFKFVFVPYSSKYRTVRDEIQINVN